LNNDRSGGQQHKKDRQQYWGNKPLTKIEFVDIDILTAFSGRGGSAILSVTDNSRGARGDTEDMVALRRITRLVATYLSGAGL
jgi:hypothetical protein